jgi:hypothetical protein
VCVEKHKQSAKIQKAVYDAGDRIKHELRPEFTQMCIHPSRSQGQETQDDLTDDNLADDGICTSANFQSGTHVDPFFSFDNLATATGHYCCGWTILDSLRIY